MPEPTPATIKRLFAVSGNRCAFPRCTNPLVYPATGKVMGEICHIKGRKPGSPRYDSNQTDDERRAFENLILMCSIHHTVIDDDPESYTAERLQEIKARHEAENATGPEPSDDIVRQLLASVELDTAIVLNADAHGKIYWAGDILHDSSTKIVIDQAAKLETPEFSETANTEGLIGDIQSALYSDNSRLPYVLVLCLDLCERVNLSQKYGKWLRKELNGYGDYREFRNEFDDEEQFEAWMQKWASHRLIRLYVKGANYLPERMQAEILKLSIDQILIAFPVAQIARTVDSARDSKRQEFSVLLSSFSQELFSRLQSFVAKEFPDTYVPPDTQAFYTAANLEQVLDGVRNIVLLLLSDARSQATYQETHPALG